MPTQQELLVQGFTPDYTPPHETILSVDEIAIQAQAESQALPSAAGTDAKIADLHSRLNALDAQLAVLDQPGLLVMDPTTGNQVALPGEGQYEMLLAGSPTPEDLRALRMYEAYQVSLQGDSALFLRSDVRAMQQELKSMTESSMYAKATGPHPQVTLLDYVLYKSSLADQAILSLEQAIYNPEGASFQNMTVTDLLGYEDPLALSLLDVQSLEYERDTLKRIYLVLRMTYYALSIDVLASVSHVRAWAMKKLQQELIHQEMEALTAVYDATLRPLVAKVLKWEIEQSSQEIERRIPVLGRVRRATVEGVYTEVAKYKQQLIDLAKSEKFRLNAVEQKAATVGKHREMKKMLEMLMKAIKQLDDAIGDPAAAAERAAESVLKKVRVPA